MKLTIDNLDGKGAVDYSATVVAAKPFRVERKLNEPSLCGFTLLPAVGNLPVPARNGRVVLSDNNGVLLFTGYVAVEPGMELTGESSTGQVYQAVVSAVSDEVLLDQLSVPQTRPSYAQSAGQMLQTMLTRAGLAGITSTLTLAAQIVSQFQPDAGYSWSKNAGALASMVRNTYRTLNGAVSMEPVGTTVHVLSETDGTFSLKALQATMIKALANDITVCGEEEPGAYVTEFFAGDGTTVLFDLTEKPWFPSASKEKPLVDLFQEPAVDQQIWQLADAAANISITSAGLTCAGGDGIDGDTLVASATALELGGSLVLEMGGVLFGSVTVGVLNGLYLGTIKTSNCVAGFQISQSGGVTTISPLINGVIAGSSFTPVSGHLYTLRLRIASNEMQRLLQSYYYLSGSGVESFGGQSVSATANVMLEVQDMTGGVASAPIAIYSGVITNAPAVCTYGLIDSSNLQCSIGSITMEQQGPVWVTSTPPGGSQIIRRMGTIAQGADCQLERTGRIRFYPASTPASGELISVSYRIGHRAVARLASAASISVEAKGLVPGTAFWIGSVTNPAPRSSADCENAASALLALATSRAAAWSGTYTGWNIEQQGDVWPGDVLSVVSASSGMTADLVVRNVQIDMSLTVPEITKYTIGFANDWADALAIKTSTTVPADAWLPQQPETTLPLTNLNAYSVTSVSGSAIQIGAGITPPAGGGFEVRRRDWAFRSGTDSDLVLRSSVNSFTIPREAASERYYIRMYDGSTPPNYSRFSSAVFVNVPL
ncbi:hypothetical protein [Paracidobacterium acidisoli]|uniref:Uncharacterized protein n=1 Tax=Paracidobacterium acidisoli TaxID=2303751 RepID=A0A372INA0_9BACT|nr:hypothetical protein [Paracidobacterium acidisoli]MBT9331869.1 hypothetical protein [Paracidobacterium acidisoli]